MLFHSAPDKPRLTNFLPPITGTRSESNPSAQRSFTPNTHDFPGKRDRRRQNAEPSPCELLCWPCQQEDNRESPSRPDFLIVMDMFHQLVLIFSFFINLFLNFLFQITSNVTTYLKLIKGTMKKRVKYCFRYLLGLLPVCQVFKLRLEGIVLYAVILLDHILYCPTQLVKFK